MFHSVDMGCFLSPLSSSLRRAVPSALPHCISSWRQLVTVGLLGDFHRMVMPLIANIKAKSMKRRHTFLTFVHFRRPSRHSSALSVTFSCVISLITRRTVTQYSVRRGLDQTMCRRPVSSILQRGHRCCASGNIRCNLWRVRYALWRIIACMNFSRALRDTRWGCSNICFRALSVITSVVSSVHFSRKGDSVGDTWVCMLLYIHLTKCVPFPI